MMDQSTKFAIMVGLVHHQTAKVWCDLFLRNWDPQGYVSGSEREAQDDGESVPVLAGLKGGLEN